MINTTDRGKTSCTPYIIGFTVIVTMMITLIMTIVINQRKGEYKLILTNTTEYVVSKAHVSIRGSDIMIRSLAPYAATTLLFSTSSDTSYRLSYTLSGHEVVSTNVGYLTSGIRASDIIAIHNDNGVSYLHKWDEVREQPR